MSTNFQTLLFSTDPAFIQPAVHAGISAIVVDWEYRGKHRRQAGADTQINHDTVEDLRRVRACTTATVICRINGFSHSTHHEADLAIQAGADEILLPMVRTQAEVEALLEYVAGRCGVGILIETIAATRIAAQLARLPLCRVYVGLNDLAIERRTTNIFAAVADGTVAAVRQHFGVPFGFGGLTLPSHGQPIPCRLLIGELARLGCCFSFLRRSFHADMYGRSLALEVPRIYAAVDTAQARSPEAVLRDQAELYDAIRGWPTRQPPPFVAPRLALNV